MNQKLSDLTFVLLFDADNPSVPTVPNAVYYVLPGHETDYKDPKQVIATVISIVAEGIAIGFPPAGLRRGVLQIEHSLTPKVLWNWNSDIIYKYHNMGINPIKYRRAEREWIVWGQDYYNMDSEVRTMVPPEQCFMTAQGVHQIELA